jgi:hypothetical protein
MPINFSSFTTTSFSFSSSSSSSINHNGRVTSSSYSTQAHSNPSGTTVRTTSQNNRGPTIQETRHYDGQGREMLGAPPSARDASNNQPRRLQAHEVEDVTDESDADRKYREAMEDEYAKREGGA